MLDTQQYLKYIESNEQEWQRQADEIEAEAARAAALGAEEVKGDGEEAGAASQ